MKLLLVGLLVAGIYYTVSEVQYTLEQKDKQCPKPELVNSSSEPWNSYDRSVIALAKIRCGFKYKRSPCLSRFEKVATQAYRVLCGAKK